MGKDIYDSSVKFMKRKGCGRRCFKQFTATLKGSMFNFRGVHVHLTTVDIVYLVCSQCQSVLLHPFLKLCTLAFSELLPLQMLLVCAQVFQLQLAN